MCLFFLPCIFKYSLSYLNCHAKRIKYIKSEIFLRLLSTAGFPSLQGKTNKTNKSSDCQQGE